jgi:predicted  nucleic acid-binding Zn-ribbon protein
MIDYLTNLLKLQALDFGEIKDKDADSHRDELRKTIPQPILAHYDRLVTRGKKGVALVRNQVCTGCHMRLPIGTINTLMQNQDIQLCDTCGRYLYLEETSVSPAAEPAPAAKPEPKSAPKTRKRKVLAQTPA